MYQIEIDTISKEIMTSEELYKRVNEEIDAIGLKRLLQELTDSASIWSKYYGFNPAKGVDGNTMLDIATQSIEFVLTQKWKWDPERSNLQTYLKNNVIKGIFRNLKVKNRIILSNNDIADLSMLAPDQFINESLDTEHILNELESHFRGDDYAFNILLGKIDGLKRREIIKEFEMSDSDYDNAMKRYKTKISEIQTLKSINELNNA